MSFPDVGDIHVSNKFLLREKLVSVLCELSLKVKGVGVLSEFLL